MKEKELVYFCHCPAHHVILPGTAPKIAMFRRSELMFPGRYRTIGKIEGDWKVEWAWTARFRHLLRGGAWLEAAPEVLEAILAESLPLDGTEDESLGLGGPPKSRAGAHAVSVADGLGARLGRRRASGA